MEVIIIDDDVVGRELLKICVERTPNMKLVGSFTNVSDAISFLKKNKSIDLILLDIELPKINGLEFLNTVDLTPKVIVVSGKKDYAFDAFDRNVVDYLIKPVNYERFLKAVNKIKLISANPSENDQNRGFIFVRVKNRLQKVAFDEIEFAEANADYVSISTKDKKFMVHSSMKNIESKLPAQLFVRVHRSFIVNLDKITTLEENTIYIGSLAFPVGRLYKEHVLERLNLI